jgi:hypothetical protein
MVRPEHGPVRKRDRFRSMLDIELRSVRDRGRCVVVALVLALCSAHTTAPAVSWIGQATAADIPNTVLEDYRRQFEEYARARASYDQTAKEYWAAIAEKRQGRNAKRHSHREILLDDYVLTQPPVYIGPPKPIDPSAPPEGAPPQKYVPVVADFLRAAAEQYSFVPQWPRDELEYKRAYARTAAAAGLTKDQIVRVYAFESGGNGKYDVQAGLEYAKPNAQAISTALGYNQLLCTNSVELMAERGDQFNATLTSKVARLSGEASAMLKKKIAALQRVVTVSRSVPYTWNEHEKLCNTPQGLGIHAMVLDIDIGPLLQTQKLLDSVIFAKGEGLVRPLTGAELEMMNLTGDGNGLDMVMMPVTMRRQVPISNFFTRSGYELNSVANRNSVVENIFAATDAKMDREVKLQGARDMEQVYAGSE